MESSDDHNYMCHKIIITCWPYGKVLCLHMCIVKLKHKAILRCLGMVASGMERIKVWYSTESLTAVSLKLYFPQNTAACNVNWAETLALQTVYTGITTHIINLFTNLSNLC